VAAFSAAGNKPNQQPAPTANCLHLSNKLGTAHNEAVRTKLSECQPARKGEGTWAATGGDARSEQQPEGMNQALTLNKVQRTPTSDPLTPTLSRGEREHNGFRLLPG
jgi:hypothetical protein